MTGLVPSDISSRIYILSTLLAALWGACWGSFINVCIYRIPREESVVKPRSHCPACGKSIPWYLNIPFISYVGLRGRCKYCSAKISPRYVIVEMLVAALFVLVWLKYSPVPGEARPFGLTPMYDPLLAPVYGLAVLGLVMGTFIDLEHMIIPNRVTLGGIVAGLILSPLLPAMHTWPPTVSTEVYAQVSRTDALLSSLLGAAVGWGILWGVAKLGTMVFRKEAMGFGDVKLMGAIGAFLGWQAVLFTIMISSFVGAIVGVLLISFGNRKMQSRIPYGPYIALAAMIWILWGPSIWSWYLGFVLGGAA